MKAFRPFMLLSLAANLALAGALAWHYASPPAATIHAPSLHEATEPAPAVAVPADGPAANWTQLNAPADAAFVARLRASGFPPHLISALVTLRLKERYADLRRRLLPAVDYPYWRQTFYEDDATPELRAARRALEREIADERRQLLGPDADLTSQAERANRARLYGNLAAEKIDQLGAIDRDYADLASQVGARAQGIILPEDREQLALLDRERRADLVALLTPEELAEYDLRSSPSAVTMRNRLRFFDPSEEEYRTLVGLQLEFDQRFGATSRLSAEQQDQRTAAQGELTAKIRATLSPARFADYENRSDQTYGSFTYLLNQFQLTGVTADTMVAMQRDLATRYNAVRQDRSLDAATRDARLAALNTEATARLSGALGAEAFKLYKGNAGPLNSLLNRPPGKP
jgi:hypothetical protein